MIFLSATKNSFRGSEKVKYEGPQSDNPLAFKHYDENKVVAGKTMKEHLNFGHCILAFILR